MAWGISGRRGSAGGAHFRADSLGSDHREREDAVPFMKTDPAVEIVLQIPTILGEGPLWSGDEQVLYWLDIFRPTINEFDPATGTNQVIAVSEPIYALGLGEDRDFVAAMESGFALLSSDGATSRRLANPNAGQNVNFNDGKVDVRGRFWSGTMARDWKSPIGVLYRVGKDGDPQAMDAESFCRTASHGRRTAVECIHRFRPPMHLRVRFRAGQWADCAPENPHSFR